MDEPTHSLPQGSIFARDFRILHKIGEGGMGVVYAVEQLSTSKPRALKLMHASLIHDTRLRDRFLQEAHTAAQIESDHVAEIVAAGVDEASGAPWLAMELLRGETLEQHVRRVGPFAPRDLLELATQMRHPLAQAHARGLVHRDLKPENLFIGQARRPGTPFTLKVLDFGIAKWVQETRSVANSQVIGSPLWMAPEQWQPRAPIGASTDVWALALVMFFALTGRIYWQSAAGEDLGRIIVEVVADPLVPPRRRAKQLGVAALVPAGFDEWFLRCLVRDPAMRIADADIALAEFEELFDGARTSFRAVHFRDTEPPSEPPPTPTLPALDLTRVPNANAATLSTSPEAIWALVSAPLIPHDGVARVLGGIAPAIVEALSVEPILVGLTEDLRLDRIAARGATAERAAYERSASILVDVAMRLGVPRQPLYAREDQREPIRIEPTTPLSFVLGPALSQITPAALSFVTAAAAATAKPELHLRAFASEIAQLRRFVAVATDIARGRAAKGPRDMVASVLRGHVLARKDVSACLDELGDACTEQALSAWLVAVDCTLARVGLLASGRLVAAAEALALPPALSSATSIDAVLADLDAWVASHEYTSARAGWGPPAA